MSIFSNIVSKIFGHHDATTTPAATGGGPPGTSPTPPSAPGAAPAGATSSAGSSAPAAAPQSPQSPPAQPVDVEAVLTQMQSQHAEQLNWRTSIVDLLKLLSLDSSLTARKELAAELHYSGSTEDSAAMNVWLHKQVMQKLAENGGKVPDDLKS
jgi:hypothetical protein